MPYHNPQLSTVIVALPSAFFQFPPDSYSPAEWDSTLASYAEVAKLVSVSTVPEGAVLATRTVTSTSAPDVDIGNVNLLDSAGNKINPAEKGEAAAATADLLTDTQLRATAVPVSGPLTDTELRATAVPVSGPLTDTELRATAVPVSGPLTDTELRATAVPVSGPLTDTELRATAVPVSAATLPLPTGAATEETVAKQPVELTLADGWPVKVVTGASAALAGLPTTLVRLAVVPHGAEPIYWSKGVADNTKALVPAGGISLAITQAIAHGLHLYSANASAVTVLAFIPRS
jgi:hypothetical protein